MRNGWTAKAALVVGMAILAYGCGKDDVERLARVGRKTAARLESATGNARGRLEHSLAALRGSLGESTVDGRVAVRLRWDQSLAGLDVRVSLVAPGVVRLDGNVPEIELRRKIVQLAQETEGVKDVQENLTAAAH